MNTLELTKKIIKQFEGLRLEAYKCSAGFWTIGYGHKSSMVKEGLVISESDAEELLDSDIKYFKNVVENLVHVSLFGFQKAALISFVFNLGDQRLLHSTLLKKLNDGDFKGASNEFKRWNKAHVDGELVVLDGLTRRRLSERDLFNGKSI